MINKYYPKLLIETVMKNLNDAKNCYGWKPIYIGSSYGSLNCYYINSVAVLRPFCSGLKRFIVVSIYYKN